MTKSNRPLCPKCSEVTRATNSSAKKNVYRRTCGNGHASIYRKTEGVLVLERTSQPNATLDETRRRLRQLALVALRFLRLDKSAFSVGVSLAEIDPARKKLQRLARRALGR